MWVALKEKAFALFPNSTRQMFLFYRISFTYIYVNTRIINKRTRQKIFSFLRNSKLKHLLLNLNLNQGAPMFNDVYLWMFFGAANSINTCIQGSKLVSCWGNCLTLNMYLLSMLYQILWSFKFVHISVTKILNQFFITKRICETVIVCRKF